MVEEAPQQQRVLTAREEILNRVRNSVADRRSERESDYAYIPRQYNTVGSRDEHALLKLFMERLQDYGALLYECGEDFVARAISAALSERQAHKLLTGRLFPGGWIPSGFDFYSDHHVDFSEMESLDGVITTCALGIAETGTIVLRHADDEPRRAVSLLPDYHLCVIFGKQVVESVPEGIRQMAAMGNVPLTTISGPSATADIEMTRVKGVHGPRTLAVILVH